MFECAMEALMFEVATEGGKASDPSRRSQRQSHWNALDALSRGCGRLGVSHHASPSSFGVPPGDVYPRKAVLDLARLTLKECGALLG